MYDVWRELKKNKMKIYLATFMSDMDGHTLTRKNARSRLTSFYFVLAHKLSIKEFREWITTGRLESNLKNKT